MKFSKKFLNKLLNSAIHFYKNKKEGVNIPLKIKDIDSGIKYFKNALEFEANKAMHKDILVDSPILCSVNLNTNSPGIISDLKEEKVTIHRKKKSPKPKTKKQIEAELTRKIIREEEKKIRNEERNKHKQEKKELKQNEKNIKKIKKEIKKKKNKLDKLKKKNVKSKNIDKLENEINIINNKYEKLNNEYKNRKSDFDDKEKVKKELKEKKRIVREKKQKEREEKRQKRKEDREKKLAEEERIYMEELYNILEVQDLSGDENDLLSEVNVDKIKIYESPLPHQRHINSLEWVNPHESLLPALLEGKNTLKGGKIEIYHGPPGTGKTYKLISILSNLLKKNNSKKSRYLICAPSNMGTINLYERAKDFNIQGTLVLSNNKLNKFPEDEQEKWKPYSDKIIFSTISMRYGNVLNKQKFQNILIDEAAQCQEAWTWGLLRNEVRNIYLAGDPQQLPALVSEDGIKFNHNRSLMKRLIDLGYNSTLLDVQRRMHPDIVKFSNENFYNSKLKTEYSGSNYDIKPFDLINIEGKEERVGTSFKNLDEAKKIIELVNKFNIKNTVIICPYHAQCDLIRELDNNLEVHTIDSFQGKEADCILITTVRTEDKIGFWKDYRRLNVALTRAKHVLRVIGNFKTWKNTESPLKLLCN